MAVDSCSKDVENGTYPGVEGLGVEIGRTRQKGRGSRWGTGLVACEMGNGVSIQGS
jgi:hypothetical protein